MKVKFPLDDWPLSARVVPGAGDDELKLDFTGGTEGQPAVRVRVTFAGRWAA
jgi:hypothetical protein